MTGRRRARLALAMLVMFAGPSLSHGQSSGVPVISGIFPPGATIGQTIEWTISGRNLLKIKTLQVSGGGIEVLELAIKDETSAKANVRIAATAEPGFREVRLDGPTGVSNLAIVRFDQLAQILEVEPNDEADQAQDVSPATAIVGVLKAVDVDHFRIKGTPGQRLTLDLEARRIGTSISPVMTLFSTDGVALAQGRESRGSDRDCRMTMILPPDGACLVQVRDNVFGGNDQARYRLRIDPLPFASGLFPLGGSRGKTIELELSGGNLLEPRRKSITLPDDLGTFVDPGLFDGPGGPVACPQRLVVEDGREIFEPSDRPVDSRLDVATGLIVNGRLSKPGEVDAYRLMAKADEKIRIKVEAAAMGSWIDSVVAVRDANGTILAENDDGNDAVQPNQARSVSAMGVSEGSTDSLLRFSLKTDGFVTIEVADRFGDGGPEYGYRLAIGGERPDFAITLLLGNATSNASAINNLAQVRNARTSPGQFGVFNLKPGTLTPINFLIAPEGRPGPVEVHVEGLPEGVTAEPIKIRFPSASSTSLAKSDPVADFLQLKVASFAQPGLSELRVVATSTPEPGLILSRDGSATIGIDSSAVSGRPITRVVNRLPLRILGESRPQFVGPPAPTRLRKVGVPGPLLQGDSLDLALEFDGSFSAADGSTIEAKAEGVGLATNTVISAGTSIHEDEQPSDVLIHVLASFRAQIGQHPVRVTFTPLGGTPTVHEVTVEVKAPIEVRSLAEAIFLKPGDSATFKVEIRREAGFDGEVELKLEGLPRGIKAPRSMTMGSGVTSLDVKLEMNSDANPIPKPVALRVVGMARMPRGNVSIDSKIRPMIQARPADK